MSCRKTVLAFLAVLLLGFAGAAPAAEKTVGVVMSGDLARYQEAHRAFVTALARAGFDQGRVSIYVQAPNPDPMSWTNSVRKFVGVEADVIVAYGAPAALAALRETSTIPVVFTYVYDPQACGVKKRNSTGVSSKVPMLTLLKTLKSITPYSRLAVLYNPDEKDSAVQLDEIKKNAPGLGYQVLELGVKSAKEAKAKLASSNGQDAVYISCSAAVDRDSAGVIDVADRKKIPAVAQVSGLAEKGALLALSPSASEQGELAAALVARILKGERPGDMAIETSKKVDLILNLKVANALGLKVPFDVLNVATKVIK